MFTIMFVCDFQYEIAVWIYFLLILLFESIRFWTFPIVKLE